MIMQWKRLGPMEYRATWQGKKLCLEYKPLEHCWRLQVDFLKIRQKWTSPVAAFNAVETTLTKLIRAQMVTVPVVKPFLREAANGQA